MTNSDSFKFYLAKTIIMIYYVTYRVFFSAELKPCGYYSEHFGQADLGYMGQAIFGVKVPKSSDVVSIQHQRVVSFILNA